MFICFRVATAKLLKQGFDYSCTRDCAQIVVHVLLYCNCRTSIGTSAMTPRWRSPGCGGTWVGPGSWPWNGLMEFGVQILQPSEPQAWMSPSSFAVVLSQASDSYSRSVQCSHRQTDTHSHGTKRPCAQFDHSLCPQLAPKVYVFHHRMRCNSSLDGRTPGKGLW